MRCVLRNDELESCWLHGVFDGKMLGVLKVACYMGFLLEKRWVCCKLLVTGGVG